MTLQKINGPECPRCGCRDSRPVSEARRWGRGQRRRCAYCNHTWTPHRGDWSEYPTLREAMERGVAPGAEDPPNGDPDRGVTYQVIRCPACRSDETRVTRTMRPIRYHKCEACGNNFKSSEK